MSVSGIVLTARPTRKMEISFHKTFSPVLKVAISAGLYLPGSDVLYPRHGTIVRYLTYLIFVSSVTVYVWEVVNELMLTTSSKMESIGDMFVLLGMGVASPTYVFMVYAHLRIRDMERIVSIWEEELTDPPYPEDRKAEIANNQRYFSKIVKLEIYCLIVPFTSWAIRPIFTRQNILRLMFVDDATVSPTFEMVMFFFCCLAYSMSTIWCATENIKLVFMKSILGELNHLYSAADKILTFKANNEAYESDPDKRREEILGMKQKLRSWIIHHQKVLRFSDEINSFLAPMVLIQDISAIIFSYTMIFILMMGNVIIANKLSGIIYIIFYSYVMYMTNSLGDEICTKSENIFEAFSGREYFWYPKDMIKNILLIRYMTAHRPIILTAKWYKSLSLKSLGQLSGKGYEIITFMKHLTSRNDT